MEQTGLSGKIFGLEDRDDIRHSTNGSSVQKDSIFTFNVSDEQIRFYGCVRAWVEDANKGSNKNKRYGNNSDKKNRLIKELLNRDES